MEKAKIQDIAFDEEDAKLLQLQTDLLLKAKGIQFSILPKLNVILEEALSRVRKIYGIEVFKEDSVVYASPNFRPTRDNELKVDYQWASMGITGTRKPIWKGFERKDGKPVKIIDYGLVFTFIEGGLDLGFHQCYSGKLNFTDGSFQKYLEFFRQNSHFVLSILNLSGMRYRSVCFDEEDNVIITFDQFIQQCIDFKWYELYFHRNEIPLPIKYDALNELIDNFVIFFPIYDSILRIAKGEKDRFEELTSKLKWKDLISDETENDTDNDDKNEPVPVITQEEKDVLAKSVDGKQIVKAGMRWQVMERDDFHCVACGVSAKDGAILHVDHVIPRSKGGKDVMDNYQTLCHQCNIGKSNKSQVNLRK